MHGNSNPPEALMVSMVACYAVFMISGIGVALVRRTTRAHLKAVSMNVFIFSTIVGMGLVTLFLFALDNKMSRVVVCVCLSFIVIAVACTVVAQIWHPIDWSKPRGEHELPRRERSILRSAIRKLGADYGPKLTPVERAAIEEAIKRRQ